jgi:general secretion pathway protein K
MNRRGFVLLTVLWTVAVLGVLVGISLRLAGTGAASSRNRIMLTRAAWAREACIEILLAVPGTDRLTALPPYRPTAVPPDSTDLGRGTWCRTELEDAGSRLDLNQASPDALRILISSDSLTDALLDWRDTDDLPRPLGAEADWYRSKHRRLPRNGPLAHVTELRHVRGFDDSVVARLGLLLNTRGTERLNLNVASPQLLATLPGFGPEVLSVVARLRQTGEPIAGLDHLGALLSPQAHEALLARYRELGLLTGTQPTSYTAVVEGGVRGSTVVAKATLMLVPNGTRLAVIRREVE